MLSNDLDVSSVLLLYFVTLKTDLSLSPRRFIHTITPGSNVEPGTNHIRKLQDWLDCSNVDSQVWTRAILQVLWIENLW